MPDKEDRPDRRPDSADRLTYRQTGVDTELAEMAVSRIQDLIRGTARPGAMFTGRGFGNRFELDPGTWPRPVLVSGADGVGTKLKIAFALDKHDTVGLDCVAMCVDDVAAAGAEPLFFLDYVATGKLVPSRLEAIVAGVVAGCRQAGCALIGGETAEMPGMYDENEYDLVGFSVGAADKDRLWGKDRVRAGYVLIGLASSGLHSNGYSLVRGIVERAGLRLGKFVDEFGRTLGEELLEPTRIYARHLIAVGGEFPVAAAAHITGGGLVRNVGRILPDGHGAVIDQGSWDIPPVFEYLARHGRVDEDECFRTWNMGLGMVMAIEPAKADGLIGRLRQLGERAWPIGTVAAGPDARVRFA
ncbi:MAG TPA: phosphoribosylformylglycinamidine cyclo-ligase [Bacillota bacterium]|jgi:phosphoribosylformylglycinamidine cyclo-ligase